MVYLLTSKDAYPWVQFGWHGWHSRSWSAYLKMKLFAPCRPSGHFSTQFGPSLKWEHFVQLSGPWIWKRKAKMEKEKWVHFPVKGIMWFSFLEFWEWQINLPVGKAYPSILTWIWLLKYKQHRESLKVLLCYAVCESSFYHHVTKSLMKTPLPLEISSSQFTYSLCHFSKVT